MSSARFTAVLTDLTPATAGEVDPAGIVQASAATMAAGGLTVEAGAVTRRRPRRVVVWVHDLDGVRVGAIT